MSPQTGPRANGNTVARGAGTAAAKGAGLILLAVVIGIVLLNVVDKDGDVDAGTEADEPVTDTTTTVAGTTDSTEPNGDDEELGPVMPPDQVAVLVLNGGAPTGSAGDMRDQLRNAGYTNTLEPSDWDVSQTGNSVLCRAGLEREAAALATAVGAGTTTADFPDPPPPGSDDADCVVVIGAAAA